MGFRILNKRPLKGHSWVDGRLTKTHVTSRPENNLVRSVVICVQMCSNKKQSSKGTLKNPKYKLHARRGKFTILFLTKLKKWTPLFRMPERRRKCRGTSNAMRYTNTHLHRQDSDAESCSARSRREETPGIERRAILADKKGKANKSVRVPKVDSSQEERTHPHEDRVADRGCHSWHQYNLVHTLLCRSSKATNFPSVKIARASRSEEILLAQR